MTAIAYYVLSSLIVQDPKADTFLVQSYATYPYPTQYECLVAAKELSKTTPEIEFFVCDPGGPDIPTRQELAGQ
jgi:hypothetical protein